MVNDIKKDAEERMDKSLQAMLESFKKIRTGRVNPAILDGVMVDYYFTPTAISRFANINDEDVLNLGSSPC